MPGLLSVGPGTRPTKTEGQVEQNAAERHERLHSAFGGGPLAALVLGSNALARDLGTSPCGVLPQQSRNTVRTAPKLSQVVTTTERIRRLGLVVLFGARPGARIEVLAGEVDGSWGRFSLSGGCGPARQSLQEPPDLRLPRDPGLRPPSPTDGRPASGQAESSVPRATGPPAAWTGLYYLWSPDVRHVHLGGVARAVRRSHYALQPWT